MDDRTQGLPGIVEAGVTAASWKARAVSLAAGVAAIRRSAEAEAILDRAFVAPGVGDFGRVGALLRLGALAVLRGQGSTGLDP